MPLSSPAPRQLAHTRVITCQGYERDDGLWDIEAHMVDTKPFSFPNKDRGGRIEADEPLHGMWMRLTIDLDMKIHAAEQATEYAPYNYCKQVNNFAANLVGEHIGPGWKKKIRSLMGGSQGCTHLTELLEPMATTAFQTLVKAKYKKITGHETMQPGSEKHKAPRFIGSCHALKQSGPVVKEHWPQYYDEHGDSDERS